MRTDLVGVATNERALDSDSDSDLDTMFMSLLGQVTLTVMVIGYLPLKLFFLKHTFDLNLFVFFQISIMWGMCSNIHSNMFNHTKI